MITYLSLHLIANKTLELVYENATKCTILKWKKKQKFSGKRQSPLPSLSDGGEGQPFPHLTLSAPSALDPHCFFDKSNTDQYIAEIYMGIAART